MAGPGSTRSTVFTASDSSTVRLSPEKLLRVQPRDASAVAGRIGEQFISLNRANFAMVGGEAVLTHDGRAPMVQIKFSTSVGAVPLVSPLTGALDLGLLVCPRFPWDGVGGMLATSGMAAAPNLLPVPPLPQSDRQVPAWVLSSVVLLRIERLLRTLIRRFELVEQELPAPRGAVDWQQWATVQFPGGNPQRVPCRFPDLQVDRSMLGFIHHVLLLQRASLQQQTTRYDVARSLLGRCERLLVDVGDVPPLRVSPSVATGWMRRPITGEPVRQALEAGLWTIEERGLAGTAELQGLAWRLEMDRAFEAFVGALLEHWAPVTGYLFRSGDRRETVIPLRWEPPYLGSQRALIPDFILTGPETTLIVDAKYKGHWDELADADRWSDVEQTIRDAHREDILQVLAYTTTQSAPRVIGLLMYPCRDSTWERLKERRQLINRAIVSAGDRQVELVLTAVPLGVNRWDAADLLTSCVRPAV